jgi:hypothetical protein
LNLNKFSYFSDFQISSLIKCFPIQRHNLANVP